MRSELPNIDAMPDSALLTAEEVGGLMNVTPNTIYRWSSEGKIAKPVRIGHYCTRWRVSDVRAALNPEPVAPRKSPNPQAQRAAA